MEDSDRYRQLMDGTAASVALTSPDDQVPLAVSPDGRTVAYSRIGTNSQLMLRDLMRGTARPVGAGSVEQRTADSGDQPRFTEGGRELVYRKGSAVYAVPFEPASGEAGAPVLLLRVADAERTSQGRTVGYDVTPDGSRFLLVAPIERLEATPNVVVLSWFDELRRRAPQ